MHDGFSVDRDFTIDIYYIDNIDPQAIFPSQFAKVLQMR